MAIPQQMNSRDRAVWLMTRFFDSFEERKEWRHTDVTEIVDALVEAARAPESEHTRAVDEDAREQRRRRGESR